MWREREKRRKKWKEMRGQERSGGRGEERKRNVEEEKCGCRGREKWKERRGEEERSGWREEEHGKRKKRRKYKEIKKEVEGEDTRRRKW